MAESAFRASGSRACCAEELSKRAIRGRVAQEVSRSEPLLRVSGLSRALCEFRVAQNDLFKATPPVCAKFA